MVTKMKFADIKSKTKDELEKLFVDLKKELYNIHLLRANGDYKDTSRVKKIKKDVARILTYLKQENKA